MDLNLLGYRFCGPSVHQVEKSISTSSMKKTILGQVPDPDPDQALYLYMGAILGAMLLHGRPNYPPLHRHIFSSHPLCQLYQPLSRLYFHLSY
ncbi:Hypothetical protein CINCED_3A025751 [Cinara cedri]|uniref:Uncharacterized protein n=1 Tax=Cinara cedri TaxID=506608 RepID=A0A5E4NA85_9HEMI|nr:Hypothetical protein CINCED_3A025751 [Cinara cedri]